MRLLLLKRRRTDPADFDTSRKFRAGKIATEAPGDAPVQARPSLCTGGKRDADGSWQR